MKLYSIEYYEVQAKDCSWKLPEKFETLKDAIKGGEEMNKREAEKGYKPSEWIVTRTTWSRCFEDDWKFISEQSTTIAMSID